MSLTVKKVDAIARILLSKSPADYDLAMEELRRLMESPEEVQVKTVAGRIHTLLAQIGVPTCTTGHMYLVEAIKEAVADPVALVKVSCPGGLYQRISDRFNAKSVSTVERGMRQCIEAAWNHGNDAFQREHFPVVSPITMVPTLLEFISRAANIVRLQAEQE